jgi:hypothetical protein
MGMIVNHTFVRTELAPPGTTLEQVFNGCKTKSIYFLKAKLGDDAIGAAFLERRLIPCGKGLARLAEVVKNAG